MFHLYLPIAGNSVNVLLIFGLGGLVGILSGIFGVGGGFLMTPLLIMIRHPPHHCRRVRFQPDRRRFHFRHPGALQNG